MMFPRHTPVMGDIGVHVVVGFLLRDLTIRGGMHRVPIVYNHPISRADAEPYNPETTFVTLNVRHPQQLFIQDYGIIAVLQGAGALRSAGLMY